MGGPPLPVTLYFVSISVEFVMSIRNSSQMSPATRGRRGTLVVDQPFPSLTTSTSRGDRSSGSPPGARPWAWISYFPAGSSSAGRLTTRARTPLRLCGLSPVQALTVSAFRFRTVRWKDWRSSIPSTEIWSSTVPALAGTRSFSADSDPRSDVNASWNTAFTGAGAGATGGAAGAGGFGAGTSCARGVSAITGAGCFWLIREGGWDPSRGKQGKAAAASTPAARAAQRSAGR